MGWMRPDCKPFETFIWNNEEARCQRQRACSFAFWSYKEN